MNKDKGPKKSIYYYYMLALAILLLLNTVIIPMFSAPKCRKFRTAAFCRWLTKAR